MGNIGIIGRARVGKDTAGKWLVDNRGYRRVALADPLKAAALELDPVVVTDEDYWGVPGQRLAEVVDGHGWEAAKDRFPDVRRILQELGRAVRALDEDFWLRLALKATQEANEAGVPVVITDVRYPNEAASLRRAGFHLIYIHRPDVPQLAHESEGALTAEDADYVVINNETIHDMHRELHLITDRIYAIESARHFARL
ncbi:hypothetical protein ACFW08_05830 [Streptomyces sp. NPDC058960]|uniref:deoxynucleotide monophosphate kinase family protein n=1 Tax=Streptomyces sp. NPDC058960 TaxID=3346679 RepID=UPI0036A8FA79